VNAVMVVEDEQVVAQDITETLRKMGYEVTGTVGSSEACVASAQLRRPDLVLMDIHLDGDVDGIDTAGLLRELFDVPVIFLSAYADDRTVSRAKIAGPLGYLLKPFRKSELKSAIEVGLFRHQLERQLRASECWFRTTLRAIADPLITVDSAQRVSFANPAARALLGGAEVSGVALGTLLQFRDERTDEPVPDPIELALARGEAVQLPRQTQLVVQERPLPIECSVAPIIDERGQKLGAVLVIKDLSEQRRTEQQSALNARLASLGVLTAGIAHEINNPLTYILGNVGFLAEDLARLRAQLDTPELRSDELLDSVDGLSELLHEVDDGAQRVASIVADLGSFRQAAPSGAGRADASQCLEWALRVSRATIVRRARIHSQLLPLPEVNADRGRLGQVFLNLLLNAAHAMQEGDPEANQLSVSSELEPAAATGSCARYVLISIRDTGSGMTPEVLGRIFDPFFTTKPVGAGTGLGLSVCHGIVSDMGGEIKVTSVPGEGSTFVVRLPVAELPAPRAESPPPLTGASARILVIDDDARVLAAVARLLRPLHEVVTARGAEDALALLQQGALFDVIVCDLLMPSMSGMDLYRQLGQQAPELARRMIFLSGGSNTALGRDAFGDIPNLILQKPPSRGELLSAIDRQLTSLPRVSALTSN
jgi:two-component system, cell cycle sensor histidine kinase and response regulator CckA